MAQKIIKLNENDIRRLVKATLYEMCGGKPHNMVMEDDDYDFDDNEDTERYNELISKYQSKGGIPTMADVEKVAGDEYHGEDVEGEFNLEDDDLSFVPDEEQEYVDNEDYPEDEEGDEEESEVNVSDNSLSDWDEGEEEQHEEGDIIYYESVPIKFTNGKYEMTVEEGDDNCPSITAVGSKLGDVKDFYDYLWNDVSYSEHARVAQDCIDDGSGHYAFNDNMTVGGDTAPNLASTPVIVDLDKQRGGR